MHISIPVNNTMEYINATQISPLISHCQIKVCYVSQKANRNNTVITKEVATEMGRKLPGSPIVGYFNKENKDFEGHNREAVLSEDKYEIIETTKPYGFVPTDAKVWFQKFSDDGVEHEYLVTEGYIWTGAYPESKCIIEKGSNQSMEINQENQEGFWTNDSNSGQRIFIYNEALIEKLCILGQEVEPCFEGAQITSFSLDTNEFMKNMYSMMNELQNILKGGSEQAMEENKNEATPQNEFSDKEKEKEQKNSSTPENKEDKDKKEEDKKKEYNLEDIAEYAALKVQYSNLQTQYSELQQEKSKLENELADLRQFKLVTERQNKQSMIDSFYMLTDEDKKDVIQNMDTYSLDDIEAKLSVICVRNKVNFSNETDNRETNSTPQGLFDLNGAMNNCGPEWLRAVRDTVQNS